MENARAHKLAEVNKDIIAQFGFSQNKIQALYDEIFHEVFCYNKKKLWFLNLDAKSTA